MTRGELTMVVLGFTIGVWLVILFIIDSPAKSCSLQIPEQHSVKVIRGGWIYNYGIVVQRDFKACEYQVKLSNAWHGEDFTVVLDEDDVKSVEE